MKRKKPYYELVEHYEQCYATWGDCHKGVDWPNFEDAQKRYRIMLEVIKERPCSILDFGCGLGHLLEFIKNHALEGINYSGADLSHRFVNLCRSKFPDYLFFQFDIHEVILPFSYDYVIANGVFTEKRSLSYGTMWGFFTSTLIKLFSLATKGLAFNLMSKHVDWEREDLFHVPFDDLVSFLRKYLSRHFVIRNDYGLYEYTVYVYKEPTVC